MYCDYVIVGSGIYGATLAYLLSVRANQNVIVLEKRNNIGGNIYTESVEGITVHKYGAHIFHTDNYNVWRFINKFSKFNNYVNSPIANYKGELYNLPFNMHTFNQMWGIITPEEAKAKIKEQRSEITSTPKNLEEQAISLVGRDIYEKLIKGYTEKQWGRSCKDLPTDIITRIPIRYSYNNNYFNDRFQGIPVNGYTTIIQKMLSNSAVETGINFLDDADYFMSHCKKVIYTGPIDAYFNYVYGKLEYRSLEFDEQVLNTENFQGTAVMNYTDNETPYTRIIEHKWFNTDITTTEKTIISKEYPCIWSDDKEPYYPINDAHNLLIYNKYRQLAREDERILFGGRLGEYKYYDMDDAILSAVSCFRGLGYDC